MFNHNFLYGETVTSVEGNDWIIFSKTVKSKKAVGEEYFFAAAMIVSDDFIGPPIIVEVSEFYLDDVIYNISKSLNI